MQNGILGNTQYLGADSKGEPSKGSQRLGGKPKSQGEEGFKREVWLSTLNTEDIRFEI